MWLLYMIHGIRNGMPSNRFHARLNHTICWFGMWMISWMKVPERKNSRLATRKAAICTALQGVARKYTAVSAQPTPVLSRKSVQ
jgi:hypothetical protein